MNETTETAADAAIVTADARNQLGPDPADGPACPLFLS
jgi:hypothetical protein